MPGFQSAATSYPVANKGKGRAPAAGGGGASGEDGKSGADAYGEIRHRNAAVVIYTDGVPDDFYRGAGARGEQGAAAIRGLVLAL